MTRRPIAKEFAGPVLSGTKFTTIREKPWSLFRPIMLYHWDGVAYRPGSKQVNVCAVRVRHVFPITITRSDDTVRFSIDQVDGRELWECEGFTSKKALHEWFLTNLKPGTVAEMVLMQFSHHSPSLS